MRSRILGGQKVCVRGKATMRVRWWTRHGWLLPLVIGLFVAAWLVR